MNHDITTFAYFPSGFERQEFAVWLAFALRPAGLLAEGFT